MKKSPHQPNPTDQADLPQRTEADFKAQYPDAEYEMAYYRGTDDQWLALICLHAAAPNIRLMLTLETFNSDISDDDIEPIVAAWIEYAMEHRIWETRQ